MNSRRPLNSSVMPLSSNELNFPGLSPIGRRHKHDQAQTTSLLILRKEQFTSLKTRCRLFSRN